MKTFLVALTALFLLGSAGFSYAGAGKTLKIDGSTTVLPIAQRAAEVFMGKNPDVRIFVTGSGSGVGIRGLIDGISQIATSSREAREREIASGREKGVILTAHKIAYDGVVPIINPRMGIESLTAEQLRDIYNGKITNWKELGGPDRPIVAVSRDTASGTYEIWAERILKGDKVRADALIVASSGHKVRTVAENRFAIGYIGIGYLDRAIKPLKIGGKSISAESVRDGSWPISRPLFMYTNGKPTGVAAEFMDFMLSKEGQKTVDDVKFVSIK